MELVTDPHVRWKTLYQHTARHIERMTVKAELSNIIINTVVDIPHEIVCMPSHPFTPIAHMGENEAQGQAYDPRNEP
ncbi:hypothetical protein BD410DRAFT_181686 [Rickenella mellea]|uniref:Uncharacterized protein n=1 Tax=Rickenella mellea TaxID=50990 RepID=A0A4Y7PGW1_9AGAM|nr:hypothetical protein BD410DRAFT_181686 [Rickenella mellea]